jgi:hypothetical protein
VLAELARGRLRTKLPALRQALDGRFSRHHARLAAHILDHLDYLQQTIEALSDEIGELIAPSEPQLELLQTITGVGRRAAECILAELGPDMSRFPTHRHAARWSCICPGNNESGGKRRDASTGVGKPLAARDPDRMRPRRIAQPRHLPQSPISPLRRRRGDSKAIVAVAHSILVSSYYALARNEPYRDPASTTSTDCKATSTKSAASPNDSKPSATESPSNHSQPNPTRFSEQALLVRTQPSIIARNDMGSVPNVARRSDRDPAPGRCARATRPGRSRAGAPASTR